MVTFIEIVIFYFGHGENGKYFRSMNKHEPSLTLLLDYQFFSIIQICGRDEKKQTGKHTTLMSVIRCVNI
jgi:hypothetical protein